jgi:hypothetical protein
MTDASVTEIGSYPQEIMTRFPVNSVLVYKGIRSAVYGHSYTDTGFKIRTVDATGRLHQIPADGGCKWWLITLYLGGFLIFVLPFGFLIGVPSLIMGLCLTPFGFDKPRPEQLQKEPRAVRSLLSLLATLMIIVLFGYACLLVGRV